MKFEMLRVTTAISGAKFVRRTTPVRTSGLQYTTTFMQTSSPHLQKFDH
jgi:hypothetical protein